MPCFPARSISYVVRLRWLMLFRVTFQRNRPSIQTIADTANFFYENSPYWICLILHVRQEQNGEMAHASRPRSPPLFRCLSIIDVLTYKSRDGFVDEAADSP